MADENEDVRIKDLTEEKSSGYAVLDDPSGTGKYLIDKIFRSVAPIFDPTVSYSSGQPVMYLGELYQFDEDHSGAWNDSHVHKISSIDAMYNALDVVFPMGKKTPIELYNTSPNVTIDADGNIVELQGSTLYRFSLSGNLSEIVFTDSGVCLFTTGPSARTKISPRLNSGYFKVPNGANYLLCASMSVVDAYNVTFDEAATTQMVSETSEIANSALNIGNEATAVASESLNDVLSIASKDAALESYSNSPQNEILPDGTAGHNENTFIARYNVQQYIGRRLCVITDNGYCFSATDSASDHITAKLTLKTFEVPEDSKVLLVCASNGYGIVVFVIEESARKSDVVEVANNVNEIAGDVVRLKRNAMRFSIPMPAKNTSVGNRIKDDGSVEANSDYYLIRYNVSNFVGKKVKIEANYNYCFSSSDSASNHITSGLRDEIVTVPTGAVTLIVSSTKDFPINCCEVNPLTKYGCFGIQFRSTMEFSQRVADAVGLNFSLNSENGIVSSDFDDCYPWCDMRLCNIENPDGAKSIVYENDPSFSYGKDVFVEVPKFYFKRMYDAVTETETWIVSDKSGDGFNIIPWFVDDDGRELPVRYIARYNLGDNISRTGEAACVQKTFNELKAKCLSAGFKLSDIYAYQALIILFAIETGNKDSQSFFPGVSYYRYYADPNANTMQNESAATNTIVIDRSEDYRNEFFGVGDRVMIFTDNSVNYNDAIFRHITSVTYENSACTIVFDGAPIELTQGVSRIYGVSQQNGRTDGYGKTCRTVGGDTKTRPFSYRGIENIYGNIGEAVDRLMFDTVNNRFAVDGNRLSYTTPQNSSYVEQLAVPKWIRYFGLDPSCPSLMLPKASLTDTISESYMDEWSTFGDSELLHVVYSCAWDHLDGNGIFCYRAVTDVNNPLYSGRAML